MAQYCQAAVTRPSFYNGTLDIDMLLNSLRVTHTNTFSFLLSSSNGKQYLDFVRFLHATKDTTIDGVPLTVWVTLVPPSETQMVNTGKGCVNITSLCPPSHPFPYGGNADGGGSAPVFCCPEPAVSSCPGAKRPCCALPGLNCGSGGCEGIDHCSSHALNLAQNRRPCNAGRTSLCSMDA